MDKETVKAWTQQKKEEFIKEGNRRVFYQSFAFYFSYSDEIAQLVVADYRTGHMNNYYYICRFDMSHFPDSAKEKVLLKALNHCIRKIHHDTDKTSVVRM